MQIEDYENRSSDSEIESESSISDHKLS